MVARGSLKTDLDLLRKWRISMTAISFVEVTRICSYEHIPALKVPSLVSTIRDNGGLVDLVLDPTFPDILSGS